MGSRNRTLNPDLDARPAGPLSNGFGTDMGSFIAHPMPRSTLNLNMEKGQFCWNLTIRPSLRWPDLEQLSRSRWNLRVKVEDPVQRIKLTEFPQTRPINIHAKHGRRGFQLHSFPRLSFSRTQG